MYSSKFHVRRSMLLVPLLALAIAAPALRAQEAEVKKDVPYVSTPNEVVDKMLELVKPKKGEVMYDLGCGDGRIVVTAAKKYGVKGTGVDIDPERIKESNENAEKAGVTDQVKFVVKDLFKMDFKDADFITLYLLPTVNERLRPQLLALRPGTRIVSHAFEMGDWEPDQEATVEPDQQNVYFWVIPAKAEGSHTVALQGKEGKSQEAQLKLKQKYQMVTGTAMIDGKEVEISDGRLNGRKLSFTADGQEYTATIGGEKDEAAGADAKAEEPAAGAKPEGSEKSDAAPPAGEEPKDGGDDSKEAVKEGSGASSEKSEPKQEDEGTQPEGKNQAE